MLSLEEEGAFEPTAGGSLVGRLGGNSHEFNSVCHDMSKSYAYCTGRQKMDRKSKEADVVSRIVNTEDVQHVMARMLCGAQGEKQCTRSIALLTRSPKARAAT